MAIEYGLARRAISADPSPANPTRNIGSVSLHAVLQLVVTNSALGVVPWRPDESRKRPPGSYVVARRGRPGTISVWMI